MPGVKRALGSRGGIGILNDKSTGAPAFAPQVAGYSQPRGADYRGRRGKGKEKENEKEKEKEKEEGGKEGEGGAEVGYSDPARAIGVVMRRAWARAWVVWGDTTERQPRTCE